MQWPVCVGPTCRCLDGDTEACGCKPGLDGRCSKCGEPIILTDDEGEPVTGPGEPS